METQLNASDSAQLDALRIEIADREQQFFTAPFQFSWWEHGGEPGAPSDHVEISSSGAGIRGSYIRVRRDPRYQPPILSEQFTAALTPRQAVNILSPLFESSLFRKQFAAEKTPSIADIGKETWDFRRQAIHLTKTVHAPFPEDFHQVRTAVRSLIPYLVKSGERVQRAPRPPAP